MENICIKKLRSIVSKYVKTSNVSAFKLLTIDMIIYISAITGILYLENIYLRTLCGIVAGLKMASLFVIAHDAAHDSYTSSKLLNKIIGRIAFLPCYHNYSLWLIQHNRLHHQLTNIKGVNSWYPISKEEYDNLPVWRQKLEKIYRSPLGIGPYYFIERWWKDKFFPYKRLVNNFQFMPWFDFVLTASFLIGQIFLFAYFGAVSVNTNAVVTILLGFIIPLTVFSYIVGFSIFQQHTHQSVLWFESKSEWEKYAKVEDFTIHVKYPKWYNLISHNVMEHTAHHVDPRIPCYQLSKAQDEINNYLGENMMTISFSASDALETMKKCKLYDYKNHSWLDFEGNNTSKLTLPVPNDELPEPA